MTQTNKETSDQKAVNQPDDLGTLKEVVKEFLGRLQNIDNELETLKTDRKELIEEFSTKLDMKTLNKALRVCKIEASVEHKFNYDLFTEVLQNDMI